MSGLMKLIKEIDEVRRFPSRKDYPACALPLDYWKKVTREARVALAALRKIKRVGYMSPGNRTEESEIAAAALKRIAGRRK